MSDDWNNFGKWQTNSLLNSALRKASQVYYSSLPDETEQSLITFATEFIGIIRFLMQFMFMRKYNSTKLLMETACWLWPMFRRWTHSKTHLTEPLNISQKSKTVNPAITCWPYFRQFKFCITNWQLKKMQFKYRLKCYELKLTSDSNHHSKSSYFTCVLHIFAQ